jgi:hypothetical protein
MRHELRNRLVLGAAGIGLVAFALACSGSSTGTNTLPPPSGTVALSLSDAANEDWAQIGVKVLGITLTPQGGGTPVTVYTAPTPAPLLNLVHLDQLSELLGNLQVPVGTYTAATLTIAANPGDVSLVTSSNPSAGFDLAPGTTVDPATIQIKHATGTAGNLTTTVAVNLVNPVVVATGTVANLDLEFDLAHPAFIVERTPLGSPTPLWAVNFSGPVRHRPNFELAGTILRHAYGAVTSVAADGTSFTFVKEHEVFPIPAGGPAPVAGLQSLTVLADATNGTIFYDEDAHTKSVVQNFSTLAAGLAGRHVRVAARYQANGTLTAVRVWASSSWASVWLSPEGHVNRVNTLTNRIFVDNENGISVPITVDANTNFFFRTPGNAIADAAPIGTGTAFLSNLVRGFKVHISVVDPLASPLVARTVDIENAKYEGIISGANTTQFTYTRLFNNVIDGYSVTLPYCAPTTRNGRDALGNQILGFKWWNFAFPTLAVTGTNAIPDFVAAVGGSATFGGTFGLEHQVGRTGAHHAAPGHRGHFLGGHCERRQLRPDHPHGR